MSRAISCSSVDACASAWSVRWSRSARFGSVVIGSWSAKCSISDACFDALCTAAIGSASTGTR